MLKGVFIILLLLLLDTRGERLPRVQILFGEVEGIQHEGELVDPSSVGRRVCGTGG